MLDEGTCGKDNRITFLEILKMLWDALKRRMAHFLPHPKRNSFSFEFRPEGVSEYPATYFGGVLQQELFEK